MFRSCFWVFLLSVAVFPSLADQQLEQSEEQSEEQPKEQTDELAKEILDDELDPAKWGIRSGCIHTNRIRNMKFIDDQSAVIKISNKKYILMTLSRPCYGVKRRGVSYETRTGQLCARFDRITSLDTGVSCSIESFVPYLLPEDDDNAQEED